MSGSHDVCLYFFVIEKVCPDDGSVMSDVHRISECPNNAGEISLRL